MERSGSDLLLSWSNDCGAGDRYGVYRGDLALGYDSLAWEACDLTTNEATIAMGPADAEFFLVVPASNGAEGPHGSVDGGQRPAASSACHPQGAIDWCAP